MRTRRIPSVSRAFSPYLAHSTHGDGGQSGSTCPSEAFSAGTTYFPSTSSSAVLLKQANRESPRERGRESGSAAGQEHPRRGEKEGGREGAKPPPRSAPHGAHAPAPRPDHARPAAAGDSGRRAGSGGRQRLPPGRQPRRRPGPPAPSSAPLSPVPPRRRPLTPEPDGHGGGSDCGRAPRGRALRTRPGRRSPAASRTGAAGRPLGGRWAAPALPAGGVLRGGPGWRVCAQPALLQLLVFCLVVGWLVG